jgi:hypothetical protein
MLSDVGGAISTGFEACVSLIRAKVDARGDARGLGCHASDLHPKVMYYVRGFLGVPNETGNVITPTGLILLPPKS